MLSEQSLREMCEHLEEMRHTAWKMAGECEESNPQESAIWRGKMYAYETVINEIARREKLDGISG